MELQIELNPIPNFPAPEGAHELAWSFVLDRVFGDAFHKGVGHIVAHVPHEGLVPLLRLRAELSPPRGDKKAVLVIGKAPQTLEADRVYLLRYGLLAPAALRGLARPPMKAEDRLFVLTLRAKLAGLGMRSRNPNTSNGAWLEVRRSFASASPTPSFYRLDIGGAS